MTNKNVVLFMVDQLSAKWLEHAIDEDICPLPNIKKLMQGGTTFSKAYANNPVCCPARATIATGMSTRGHGVLQNGYILDPKLPTFMKSLQNSSYKTAAIGKLHFRPHYENLDHDYRVYGFDEIHITEDCRSGEWLDWVRENYPEHYDSVLATIWTTPIPEFSQYGENKENLTDRILKIKKDFKWATEEYPRNTSHAYALPFPKEVSQTEWITNHALDYINRIENENPFFVQISYVQPHSPFGVPGEYLDLVDEKKIPQAVKAEWETDPDAPVHFKSLTPSISDDQVYERKCYFADVCHLDEQLGKVVEGLKAKDLLDDTYIIFFADHGELLGDHGLYAKGARHYDACIRVPLIISGPGIQKNCLSDCFVQTEDIAPTILEMTSVHMPEVPAFGEYAQNKVRNLPKSHGSSLLGMCKGERGAVRTQAYCESYGALTMLDYTDYARSVITDRYRYTYYAGNGGEQLFDLINDPDETINLSNDTRYSDHKTLLIKDLLEHVVSQDWPKTLNNLFSFGVH